MAAKKYGIVLDTKKCLNCKACTVACKFENGVPPEDGMNRNWVAEKKLQGTFPNLSLDIEPSQCQHCDNPPCVHVCPTRASYVTEEGVVLINYDKCILCKYCMTACPYDARYDSHEKEAIDKCTFCYHRLPEGREPACVETCPTRVRMFVNLEDSDDAGVKLMQKVRTEVLKPEKGTKPKLFYIK